VTDFKYERSGASKNDKGNHFTVERLLMKIRC